VILSEYREKERFNLPRGVLIKICSFYGTSVEAHVQPLSGLGIIPNRLLRKALYNHLQGMSQQPHAQL
jgi:hypothetical protein